MTIGTEYVVNIELAIGQQEQHTFAAGNCWELPHKFDKKGSGRLYLSPSK